MLVRTVSTGMFVTLNLLDSSQGTIYDTASQGMLDLIGELLHHGKLGFE